MNKVYILLFSVAIASATLMGCAKNTPKDVAKEWLTDFYHMDYEGAKKLSTEEGKLMISTIEGFTNSFDDSIKQKAKTVTITIKDVKVEGDKAYVTFVGSNAPNGQEPPLRLVKQNDKWLVMFTKSDFKPSDSIKAGNGATIVPDATPATTTPDANMTPDTAK